MSYPENPFPPGTKPEDTRHVDVSIEIDAPAEEVWPYLGTSRGLSSWYVKADFSDEKAGASCTLDFGGGMVVPAYVQAYEVKKRVRLGPPPEVDHPRVEEYRLEAKAGGKCVVRVVNWGFGEGSAWDDEYESVRKGWTEMLKLLKQVVEQFRAFGPPERIQLLAFAGDRGAAFATLREGLGIGSGQLKLGDRVEVASSLGAPVRGVVDAVGESSLGVLQKGKAGGVLLRAAAETGMGTVFVQVILLAFGDERGRVPLFAEKWGAWFGAAFPPSPPPL